MNKSLVTNLVALLFIGAGYFSPWAREQLLSVGIFALSGAVTNWLAVFMLFERVPFLYGSGVIPRHFDDIKEGLKSLVMEEFFSDDKIDQFFADSREALIGQINIAGIADKMDFNPIYDSLIQEVLSSGIGGMLGMFGGPALLEKYREPAIARIREYVAQEFTPEKTAELLAHSDMPHIPTLVQKKVEDLVQARLDELTPEQVKRIVQDMIRQHLGWLVVWGGVFGGLIGLAVTLLPI
ncbi:MAG: hypothetical protein PQJ60_11595 [Spirochaetales bacterium]|nr:hypothetical protein [Spirochaetales bacterium]